nr:MAG TPA: hypothetical protein [Caudoviricetes sp.]
MSFLRKRLKKVKNSKDKKLKDSLKITRFICKIT